MKRLKKRLVIVVLILSVVSPFLSSSCIALPLNAFKPFTPIDMSSGPNQYGGYYYIFSDFPEWFMDTQLTKNRVARYTISRPAPGGHDYVVEYYHMNGAKEPLRIGVALVNKSSSECTVTVKNVAKGDTGGGLEKGIKMCADVQRDYQASIHSRELDVPGKKNNTPGYAVALEQPFPYNTLAYGKVKIYVPKVSEVEIRIFVIKEKSGNSNIAKCTECDAGRDIQRTCGMFSCDTRYITFDTTVSPKTFYLGFVNDHYNPNEYEKSICPVRGRAVIEGNYGLTYDIEFANTDISLVNYIRITPQWKYIPHTYQEYVVYDGSDWTIVHVDKGKSTDIPIPENKELKFILPGSGCGNICFDLIKK